MNQNEQDVFSHFLQLHHAINRHHIVKFQEMQAFKNPTRGQGRILSILKMKPEITQKELLFLLNMSKQSLAELLSKLEKNGFIIRQPSPTDRRVSLITLTEKGKLVQVEDTDKTVAIPNMFKDFTEIELASFDEYILRLLDFFKEQLKNDKEFIDRQQAIENFMKEFSKDPETLKKICKDIKYEPFCPHTPQQKS